MTEKAEILQVLRSVKAELLKAYPVKAIALFGSFSRGDFTKDSDIDILVEIDGKIGGRFIDLANEIEVALGRKVDVVSKNGIKPRYLNRIKEELIYV
jgi:hypothetical protein